MSTTSLDERFGEIESATRASAQVSTIISLAKSPKLERSRESRLDAWHALRDTCTARLEALESVKPAKRARKPVDKVPIAYAHIETPPAAATP